jgi:hypothetical protein
MFTLVGMIAQLVDGTLGMAYGVTASTAMMATGTSIATASASVHLAEVGTTLVSGLSHWRFGNVNWRAVSWLAVPGGVGGFLGATALTTVNGAAMRPVVAGLLLALGLTVIWRFASRRDDSAGRPRRERTAGPMLAPLGLVGGVVDAIGGGGWGPITTPTLITVGHMAPHRAVGTASASEFVVSLAASIGFLAGLGTEVIDSAVVAGLLVGGAVVAPLAAWLVRRASGPFLGVAVGTLLVATNLRTLLIDAPDDLRRLAVTAVIVSGGSLAMTVRSRNDEGRIEEPDLVVQAVRS